MRNRAGFTMVELLIVTVLGSLVVMAAYQVLLVNQRTYAAQNAQVQSQQTVRAGMDILFGELREISRAGSDIGIFTADSLQVRAGRSFGLVCAANPATGVLDVRKVGSWFGVGDSVAVYAENSPKTAADDDWIYGRVTARDTTITCSGRPAQRLTIPRVATAAATDLDTVRVGANVRGYAHYTYSTYTFDGQRYLGRKDSTNTTVPLVGPLQSSAGLAFRYLDSLDVVTTTASSVSQIEVTLRTLPQVRGPNGNLVADSVTTRIYVRN